jgi:O-antigen/teichoic acid export membrane protein
LGHSKNYVAANFFLKGLAFITLPVFTRLLTPADYGTISIFSSIAGFFIIFLLMGVDSSKNLYFFEKGKDFNEFFGSNVLFLLAVNIILAIAIFVFIEPLSQFFATEKNIVLYAFLSSLVNIPFILVLGYYQLIQDSKKYSFYNILKYSLITVISIVIILLLTENKYYGRIYAEFVISFTLFIVFLPKLIKLSKFNFRFEHVKYTLLIGLPLMPYLLTQLILNFADRIIINMNSGETDVGLYSFAYNIGMVINTVIVGMNQSWAPIFYGKLRDEKYEDIFSLSPKFFSIIFSLAIVLIVFSRELVIVLGEKRYYSSFEIIPFIVLGYVFVFLYTIYANYAFYFKRNLRISLYSLISAFINIVLNLIFVPIYGYKFASVSTMISFFILFVIQYIDVRNYVDKSKLILLKNFIFRFNILIVGFVYFYVLNFFNINLVAEFILNVIVTSILILLILKNKKLLSE